MDLVNAISRIRFSAAKPQYIQLEKNDSFQVDLLCMESGQDTSAESEKLAYYVVTGTATLSIAGKTTELTTGHLAITDADEPHSVSNAAEQRLVCLVLKGSSGR